MNFFFLLRNGGCRNRYQKLYGKLGLLISTHLLLGTGSTLVSRHPLFTEIFLQKLCHFQIGKIPNEVFPIRGILLLGAYFLLVEI